MSRRTGADSTELSLTPCGPFDRGLARVGLVRQDNARLALRAVVPALVAWIPLFFYSLVRPTPDTPTAIPFLHDLAAHVRFLLFMPLLVFIERSIGRRTGMVASSFLTSGLVPPAQEPAFRSAIRRARALLESTVAELILAGASFGLVWLAVNTRLAEGAGIWFGEAGPGGPHLSPAGWWYVVWSTYALFLFLRWVWRYLLWCGFLRGMSQFALRAVGTHPDRAGGLGFVTLGHSSFAMLSFAASCIVTAGVGSEILNQGARLMTYKYGLLAFLVIAILVGVLPLLVFMKLLVKAKHAGLLRYGEFALRYVQDFDRKWCEEKGAGEPALGSGDIQSLADLGGSFERLQTMRTVPIDTRTAGMFALTTAGPMLPLLLTVMPLKDIVQLLIKAVL